MSDGRNSAACGAQPTGGRARYNSLSLAVEMMAGRLECGSISVPETYSIRREGSPMLFAYFGPETMMPVASVIAAAAGVVMMFGRSIVQFGRGLVKRVWPGPRPK